MVLVMRKTLFHVLKCFLQKVVTLVKLLVSTNSVKFNSCLKDEKWLVEMIIYTFPAPTGPIIATKRPGFADKLIFSNVLSV